MERQVVSRKVRSRLKALVLILFLAIILIQWEAERLQPQEIFAGVVVTIVGAFVTRMLAIAFRLKGWVYGW